jgi:beta-aspartyl-peptidase (threonine type)
MTQPSLIVHGGAGHFPPESLQDCQEGVRAACAAGWEALQKGGSALDSVEAAVRILEDHPGFDAGRGSVANQHGEVEMDAMIMDGATLALGAVAAVKGVRYPIALARLVMTHTPHAFLVAEGARMLAEHYGLEILPTDVLLVDDELAYRHRVLAEGLPDPAKMFGEAAEAAGRAAGGGDTVGAVARDGRGNIAAGTSTGGKDRKLPGRVGDSPLVGSGGYADNEAGGASSTGDGEKIMRMVMAKAAVDALRGGESVEKAAQQAVNDLKKRTDGEGGIILIDRQGRVGYAFNTPTMLVAWVDAQGQIQARADSR